MVVKILVCVLVLSKYKGSRSYFSCVTYMFLVDIEIHDWYVLLVNYNFDGKCNSFN